MIRKINPEKIRCKLGISLIALAVTIVITIILIATVVITSRNALVDTSKRTFAREIYIVEQKVDEYRFRNAKYPIKQNIAINIEQIDENSKDQFSDEPDYQTGTITLQEIDLYEAEVETVNRGTRKEGEYDVYVLSENTGKLYYLKGYKAGGNTYYTLTDELLDLIDISK